jgi:hypothetical protein
MLKDNLSTYNLPQPNDLSVEPNHEVIFVLDFIDRNISKFRLYYQTIKDSDHENRISDFLVSHLQLCINEERAEGFPPLNFRKNPTQPDSGKETDIGVIVLTRNTKPVTIIEFESKRFSDTSNNKEYVCGKRGGIERFKRGEHASHLSICGMFGYIQNRQSAEWIQRINIWIEELSKTNPSADIDWSNIKEQLVSVKSFPHVEKYVSINSRGKLLVPIMIYHYFLNLC